MGSYISIQQLSNRLGIPRSVLLVSVLPGILLIPAITEVMPFTYYNGRETGFYFVSLSIVQKGIRSWFILTAYESYASPHLFSLLSAPFVALGFTEGGRLVSLVSMVGSAVTVGYIAKELFTREMAIVASGLLWIHPFLIRTSFVYHPEALSILSTCLAVALSLYCIEREVRNPTDLRFLLLLSVLFVSPTIHTWEASIVLPVVGYFLFHRFFSLGIIAGITSVTGVIISNLLTSLQPGGQSGYSGYILDNPSIFLDPSWWIPLGGVENLIISPLNVGLALTFYVAVVFSLPLLLYGLVKWQEPEFLIGSWMLSGVLVVVLLAGGYSTGIGHIYYMWAVPVPVIMFFTLLTYRINISFFFERRQVVATMFIILSVLYIAFVTYGVLGISPYGTPVEADEIGGIDKTELREAGMELRSENVESPAEVAFVGDWRFNPRKQMVNTPGTVVLMYAEVLLDYRTAKVATAKGDPLPEVVPNRSEVETAEHCVILNEDNDIIVEDC